MNSQEINTKNKIKIAFIISNLERCGPVNILYNLIKYLNKDKFEIIIITLSKERKNSRLIDFKRLNCRIKQLNNSRIAGIFKNKKYIEKILEDEKISIIHTHGFRADLISYKLTGVRKICTLHNYPYDDYVMTYGKIKGNVMAYIHTKILNNIDMKCACSESVSKLFKYNKNIIVEYVRNGVDLEDFPNENINIKEKVRKKLNLPIEKNIFIVVGNVTKRKDIITIIKSFSNPAENDMVLFLGDGDLYEQYKEENKNNLNIKFVGRVSNVSEYMIASDYYISASLAEGLPNTVLEAMSTGLPVILSDIDPHLEICNFNHSIVSIFERKNVTMLKNAIKEIKNKDYNELSIKSRRLIEENLSAKIMAANYEKKYFEII